ncbi:hypothetical protein U1Q18_007763, partial [Sarracenia purpurea var. burkii]
IAKEWAIAMKTIDKEGVNAKEATAKDEMKEATAMKTIDKESIVMEGAKEEEAK